MQFDNVPVIQFVCSVYVLAIVDGRAPGACCCASGIISETLPAGKHMARGAFEAELGSKINPKSVAPGA